jgi:TP901 family phage tail tape measure protein
LNQLNLTQLSNEFKKAGISASDFYNKLVKAGNEGVVGANALIRTITTANTQLKQSSQLLDKMAITFKNTVRYGISSSIFNSFTNSVQKAYDYTKQLDTSLNDIRIVSNQSAEQMADFAVSANKAAQALGKTTLDYTKAATIYFQQGLSSDEVEKRTEVTLKAANVTGQNAQQVSEQLTAVWNGYQVTGEKLEEYVDKLSAVAASSASNLEELSTGMSKVASAANIMGVDIDQLNAQMSTIISVTRQAPESVGTALRTIYARMADIKAGLDDETTLGNYSGKMAKLGFSVLDASGNLKDMGNVIEEIGGK